MNPKSVLFIDPCAPTAYADHTLYTTSQGGTESTVTRIAEGLGARGWEVTVEQAARDTASLSPNAIYTAIGSACEYEVGNVVVLRHPNALLDARRRFPKAKLYLWSHDLYTNGHAQAVHIMLQAANAKGVICVSNYHRQQILAEGVPLRVQTIYNPVDPIILPLKTEHNPHQLVWFSSPHKGLKLALELFSKLYKKDSRFTFKVHNPGYFPDAESVPDGVQVMPRGSFLDALKTVSESMCVFYPNTVFPETFGLVFAEADQLGTPVLTHDLGAAREVLDHPRELINCFDDTSVIERVMSWSRGSRPVVRGKPQFKMPRVLNQWEKILAF